VEEPVRLPLYQIDAFTDRLFGGNPAAVVPLEDWLPAPLLQAIAAENNLAETAFFVREGEGYALRWFTPTVEVDLCGHATLATAWLIFDRLEPKRERVSFRTLKFGTLSVGRAGDTLVMDFPIWPAEPCGIAEAVVAALGARPAELYRSGDRHFLAVFDSAEEVAALAPDFGAMKASGYGAVIATAAGRDGIDFVSRFFAPSFGIDEDPVTGSAHCMLTPYWAKRLGKATLEARQISRRGGALRCSLSGDRVILAGRCVPYLEGTITV
jgi:PhzF family phenazine biosynthesis protein